MTRQKLTISLVAAAFAFSLTPVLAAQDTRGGGQAGSRPNPGTTSGSAAPRGEGSSGSSGSSGTTSSSSGGSSAGSSSSSGMGPSGSSGYAPVRERAPERPSASERRGGNGGERAVPRGAAAPSGDNARGMSGAAGASSTYYGEGRNRTPVPAYSRPRDGRTAVGTAAERTAGIPGDGGYYPIYPIYDPGWGYNPFWGYGIPSFGYGYGYGFGYFGYDPFLFGGYYDPYYSGYGQSSGGYGTGGYHGAVGSLRLKVKPVNAQVYVDGYYVGVVDSFDGTFQRLEIEAGSHRVEVRAEGFTPVQFDVMVTPGETITYKGQLQPIR